MVLPQLDALIWRDIALQLPDPSSFAATCKLANKVTSSERFRRKWFLRFHAVLVPDRPWQYAAVTWQQMQEASPEQLADFLISCITHQYEVKNAHNGSGANAQEAQRAMVPRARSPLAAAAPQQLAAGNAAAQGQQAPAAGAAEAVEHRPAQLLQHDRCLSAFPECQPLPSVMRRARHLLQQGRTLDALMHLCPSGELLLQVYAAKTRNTSLLKQLMVHRNGAGHAFFPYTFLNHSQVGMQVRTDRACCYAALSSGKVEQLQLVLMSSTDTTVGYKYMQLLRHAARHSNTACIELLLHTRASNSYFQSLIAAAPEHLAMAAARTDDWAPGAVSVLLRNLAPKQCKPAYMRPTYIAACRTGNRAVLQLLLGVAAAAPRWHLPVLLEAAAVAGNDETWQWLLFPGADDHSNSKHDCQLQQSQNELLLADTEQQQNNKKLCMPGGQQGHESQNELALPQATVQHFDWSALTAPQLLSILHSILPVFWSLQHHPGSTQQQQWATAEQEKRLAMADLFWQHVVLAQGREQQLRQHVLEGEGHKVLMLWSSHSGFTTYKWFQLPEGRIMWLQEHKLIPEAQQIWVHHIMNQAVGNAFETGDFRRALQLYRWLQAQPVPPEAEGQNDIMQMQQHLQHCMMGHLRNACATADAALVAQIDRLTEFNNRAYFTLEFDLHRPVLLRTVMGGFKGRAVTLNGLAQELGIPWQLLRRIVQQYIQAQLSRCRPDELVIRSTILQKLQSNLEESITRATDARYQSDRLQHAAWDALLSELSILHTRSDDGDDEGQNQQQPEQQQAEQQPQHQPEQHHEQQQPPQQQLNGGDQVAEPVAGGELVADLEANAEEREMYRQLTLRLQAGEVSIPPSKQAQLGPMPLWQQCIMEVISNTGLPFILRDHDVSLYETLTAGMVTGGPIQQLQCLLSSPDFVTGPPVTPLPWKLPWGEVILRAAIELQQPQLLQWSLQPERRQQLWGAGNFAVLASVLLHLSSCSPISSTASRRPEQHQLDVQQLRQCQQRQKQQGQHARRPPFAQAAADSALALLEASHNTGLGRKMLSRWLQHNVRPSISEPDLIRARAVMAAVAGAEELPNGALECEKEAMITVLKCGDVDLLGLVMCWANRLQP